MEAQFRPPFAADPPQYDPNKALGGCVLNRVSNELKEIIKRDLNRKVIESMAFKVYEAWWDGQSTMKNPKVLPKAPAIQVKMEPGEKVDATPAKTGAGKLPALLNTFDPLNWAKGSLEMDGFRIGLGLRSAISKMPSFRVKKRSPSPVIQKKPRIDDEFSNNMKGWFFLFPEKTIFAAKSLSNSLNAVEIFQCPV